MRSLWSCGVRKWYLCARGPNLEILLKVSRIGGSGRGSLHDHLLAGEQRVADELASPQSNGSVGHFGGEW
jgi:hypothetical protein